MTRNLLACFLLSVPLPAITITSWHGLVNNSWTNAGNWDHGVPLNSGVDVYNAIIVSTANNPVLLSTSLTISGFTLGASSALSISSGNALTVKGGPLSIGGTVTGDLVLSGAATATLGNNSLVQGMLTNSATGTIQVNNGNTAFLTNFVNPAGGQITASAAALAMDAGGSYTNHGNIAISGALLVRPQNGNSTVTLAGSGTLTMSQSSVQGFYPIPAALENAAGHTIQGNGGISTYLVNHGTVVASGGTLHLTGGRNDGTIRVASGSIEFSSDGIDNTGGSVVADASPVLFQGTAVTGGTLTAQYWGSIAITAGTASSAITVKDNGMLTLDSGLITGSVDAKGTSKVILNNATIRGSTQVEAGAELRSNSGTSYLGGAVTNNGLISVNQSALSLDAGGSYTNNGDFSVINGALLINPLSLAETTVTLGGNGTLSLSQGSVQGLFPVSVTLENGPGHTIQGNGGISARLVNHGTVIATGGQLHLLEVDNDGTIQADTPVSIGPGFANFNNFTLTGGSYDVTTFLEFTDADIHTNRAAIALHDFGRILDSNTHTDALTNFNLNDTGGSFTITGNAVFNAPAGGFTNNGAVSIEGPGARFVLSSGDTFTQGPAGSLSGSGTLVGDVDNEGAVSPGNSPGTLTIQGSYFQAAGAFLDIEFATPSLWDQLVVLNSATLNGTLRLLVGPGFDAALGQQFLVFTAGSISGHFDSFITPYFAGSKMFREFQAGNYVFVQVEQAPEPVMTALTGLSLALLLGARRRFRR